MELSTSTTTSAELNARLQSYLAEREALIEKEKALRHDYAFRQSLSPTAKQACEIVQRVRKYEEAAIWAVEENGENGVYPGMSFMLAKERMENSELWKIVKQLPKGCLLHSHFEAMVDVEWIIELGLTTPGMHICSDIPILTPADLTNAQVQFKYSKETPPESSSSSLYSPSYLPNTLIPACTVASAFPPHLLSSNSPGGRADLVTWLRSRTSITPEESLLHHEGLFKIWAKFQATFGVLSGIIFYEPNFRAMVYHLMENCHSDNIYWVDVRMAFHMNLLEAHTGTPLPLSDVIRIFGEEVARYKANSTGFWGARIIWTTIRRFGRDIIISNMKSCIAAKKLYPHIIAGYDLVGQEDLGRPFLDLLPELLWFTQTCADEGVSIPLFLHAGETLGDGTAHDNNLYDALLLPNNKRIGHGFSLYKHPHLMQLAKEKNICLEVCPISNEILRLTNSILSHPLPAFLASGIAVSLNNDDPGILGQKATGSLTHDYWQVLQAFDNVGLEGLGDLAETGVRFAAFEDEVEVGVMGGLRNERMKEWREKWEEFCGWVVGEYGGRWGV